MIVTERTQIPDAALPLDVFKSHLRLGRGFGTESLQDTLLLGFLRASIAAIETRIGKVLIQREFTLTLSQWRDNSSEPMPLRPVTHVDEIALLDSGGGVEVQASDSYYLDADAQSPMLRPVASCLPRIPAAGQVRIEFEAGIANDFSALPDDLQQAVTLLAAHYYEYRDNTGLHRGCMPFGVTSLIERHRVMRLTLGARK